MSSIAINLDPLLYGAVIALLVAAVGTPVGWRLLRGLPHAIRALATSLGCIGAAGLLSLPFALSMLRMEGTALATLVFSAVLQGAALLILLLLPRRA
jgi:hypothetical protein